MKNELQIVTYQQAVALRKLGFNWGTKEYYDKPFPKITKDGLEHNNMVYLPYYRFGGMEYNSGEDISAPTTALALKWFRDEKGIIGSVLYDDEHNRYEYKTQWVELQDSDYFYKGIFETYEAAESALLDELINLINKQNEQTI
jgi:hypothetical protein